MDEGSQKTGLQRVCVPFGSPLFSLRGSALIDLPIGGAEGGQNAPAAEIVVFPAQQIPRPPGIGVEMRTCVFCKSSEWKSP